MSGHFIVIEGLEGAGKSSAISCVRAYLQRAGKEVVEVREPGGTPLAEALRDLVKRPWQETVSAEAELLIMYAARKQLVDNVIQPALEQGQWVIGDRHDMSSQAYQGGGRQLGRDKLATMRALTLGNFKPQLTLYLDIDPALGLARARGRGELDRIETEHIDFFHRTRQRYLELATADSSTVIIDAAAPLPDVHQAIEQALASHLQQAGEAVL